MSFGVMSPASSMVLLASSAVTEFTSAPVECTATGEVFAQLLAEFLGRTTESVNSHLRSQLDSTRLLALWTVVLWNSNVVQRQESMFFSLDILISGDSPSIWIHLKS